MAAFAANGRLYLKDGDYEIVREYQVLADRVRYYSTERGDWEEIPLELVDLDRTKKDAAERQAAIEADAKEQDVEDKAIRAERKEAASVPVDPGVYYVTSDKEDKIHSLQLAEVAVNSSKGRTILKVLAPVPIVPGKSSCRNQGRSGVLPGGRQTSPSFTSVCRTMSDSESSNWRRRRTCVCSKRRASCR